MRVNVCALLAVSLALASPPLRAEPSDGLDVGGLGQAIALESLDGQRGGQAVQQIDSVFVQSSNQNVDANLNANALQAGINGANNIGNGVFSGASGLTTLIQNSGNQVIIQNSTIINLLMK